ncbi:CPBP family intramembrane glutamic endopeptidase [Pseudoneobacillus sp. C159]
MKKGLIRIASICVINFVLNYLLLFPLGLFKYLETPDLKMFSLIGIIISGIPALATLLFLKLVDRKQVASLGFRFKRKDFLFSVAAIFVTLAIFTVVVMVCSNIGVVSAKFNTAALKNPEFYLFFLLVFITWFVAAFYEELLFRGYFVANLSFLSPKKLYVMTSIIFMVFHVFRGFDLLSNVLLMFMSCVFLTIYLKSGSILPCTFAHLIFNFTNTHLVGSSEIALLKFNGDLGIYNLMNIVAYSIGMVLLAKIVYGKKLQVSLTKNSKFIS